MKKILLSIGTLGTIVAPVATLVACGTDKVAAPFQASTRTDDQIAQDIADNAQALAIRFSPSLQNAAGGITPDLVKAYWNKPEGETFILAAVTNAIGAKIWKYISILPSPPDTVIRAIVFGVKSSLTVKGDIDANLPEEQAKKIASDKLNVYKVALINNIDAALNKYGAKDSLQKFDGFINWFIKPDNKYENLRSTLISGIIDGATIQGIQDELNYPTDTMITANENITIINPSPAP